MKYARETHTTRKREFGVPTTSAVAHEMTATLRGDNKKFEKNRGHVRARGNKPVFRTITIISRLSVKIVRKKNVGAVVNDRKDLKEGSYG